jgi:hypothetical protein
MTIIISDPGDEQPGTHIVKTLLKNECNKCNTPI